MKTNKLKLTYLFIIAFFMNACVPKISYETADSVVTLNDGTQINCKIDYPINQGENNLKIYKGSTNEKIAKKEISTIVVSTSSGKTEYSNLSIYNYNGKKITKDKKLLGLSMKGKVNLYFLQGSFYEGNTRIPSYYTQYYCKRENEKAATCIHPDMNVSNKNTYFRLMGRKYFADNAELSKKIDDKFYTYQNIIEVVIFYNTK